MGIVSNRGESRDMDQEGARAALQHYFDCSADGDEDRAHEIYLDEAVMEFPQSGERFEGVPNFREWRRNYPADVDLEIRRVRGGGNVYTAEVAVRYDGGPWNYGVSIHEFRGDRIAVETIYYAEPFEAPEWRARWRAAPPPTDPRAMRS
jgi:ketosteroid isomerase-like protein